MMVVKSKAPWEQVAERCNSLGKHLHQNFDELSADATAERVALEKSLRAMLSALEDGLGATGKVVRDAKLREDITELAASVREALLATFEGAGNQLRERLSGAAPKTLTHKNAEHKTVEHKTVAHK